MARQSAVERPRIAMDRSLSRHGALAVASGAALWGLFWIPLRMLDATGTGALWSIALVSAGAMLAALAVSARRGEFGRLRELAPWRLGTALGLSTVLYFVGVLLSDVVRVVFLFYLLPVWTILAARLLHGTPIRGRQLAVVVVALLGMWLLLGGASGTGALPLPSNLGDLCGLAAGLCWGVSLALLRGREVPPPFVATVATLAVACVLAAGAALSLGAALPARMPPPPDAAALLEALPLGLGFGALVLYPAMIGQIWGARLVPAATAALLTMSEILVATASAWWLIGTTLDASMAFGGLVIVTAVLLDAGLPDA